MYICMGNHEAQPSRGTKRRRDEKQTIKRTPHMKTLTHKQKYCKRGTALERSLENKLFK